VTASELLAMLGRAWSRLLLYPGGLAAFGLLWLISIRAERRDGSRLTLRVPVLGSIALPWLALALLPLPLAAGLPRQIDIVVALALLEWPQLLAIRQALRAGDRRRLAAALNSYPTLVLATLALAQSAGSFDIVALARPPSELASTSASVLHWIGALALALALAPALGIGPFGDGRRTTDDGRRTKGERPRTKDQGRTTDDEEWTTDDGRQSFIPTPTLQLPALNSQAGLRLRALGLIALAALPWAGSQGDGLALLRWLAAASLIAALLWCFVRLARQHTARRWARVYLVLDAALLLALLWAAYMALQRRLV
jgi:hypothetical protein